MMEQLDKTTIADQKGCPNIGDRLTSPSPDTHREPVDFSIIIPVKDSVDMLEVLLRSISENAPESVNYEIIVADDGSTVDLEDICRRYGTILCRSEISLGPSDARNRGAQAATGNILLFLDADVVYAKGLMERAKAELDRDPDLYAVSFMNQPYDAGNSVVANYVASVEHYWYTDFFDQDNEIADVKGITT
ncbi:MAG: glycosyltransferase family 2 protein, partial [Candidatus Hydrogenedentes bacterium]|nr:glycosyltransferase family 2 protein [Candidatus Hydrogenedentota bacterium]